MGKPYDFGRRRAEFLAFCSLAYDMDREEKHDDLRSDEAIYDGYEPCLLIEEWDKHGPAGRTRFLKKIGVKDATGVTGVDFERLEAIEAELASRAKR